MSPDGAATGLDLRALDPPVEIDGRCFASMLRPESVDELARALQNLARTKRSVVVRGGGSHDGAGRPLETTELMLCTGGLDGIQTLDQEEGVMQAGAGTPLATLREALEATGWELPLDPPGPAATLGGSLAAAAAGPCFPQPRDAVLGLEVVNAQGKRTRCGGRVVKNVTGYDLAKLYVGSRGTLGVISSAWLRLRPRPEHSALHALPLGGSTEDREGSERVLAAARLGCARAAVGLDAAMAARCVPGAREATLLVELVGDPAAMDADAAWLAQHFERHDAPPSALAAARAFGHSEDPERAVSVRLDVVPSQLAAAGARLRAAGAEVVSWPGRGTLFARVAPPAEGPVARLLAAVSVAAASGRGAWRIEFAPVAVRAGRSICGGMDDALPLMRALAAGFDGDSLLNPGRARIAP